MGLEFVNVSVNKSRVREILLRQRRKYQYLFA